MKITLYLFFNCDLSSGFNLRRFFTADFNYSSDLDQVPTTAGTENFVKQYSCSECDKVYLYRQGLYTHRKFECGKKPSLPCPYCPYKAKRPYHLQTHLNVKHY